MTENTIFGTQQALWKERLWGNSVLEENIRAVAFINGGSLRLLCVGIFIQFSEEFCDYLLENYIDADSTFPPPVWFEYTA